MGEAESMCVFVCVMWVADAGVLNEKDDEDTEVLQELTLTALSCLCFCITYLRDEPKNQLCLLGILLIYNGNAF